MKQLGLKLTILFAVMILSVCSNGEKRDAIISETFKGNRLLPEGVSRIYIDEVSDGSINSTAKETFDIVLRRRINLNPQLSLIDTPDNSDLVLKLRLTGYSSKPVKYNESGEVIEKKLRLNAYVHMIYIPAGEEKIRNKLVESELVYSDKNPPIMSEYNAITSLTDLLAERIVSVVTTGFYNEKSR